MAVNAQNIVGFLRGDQELKSTLPDDLGLKARIITRPSPKIEELQQKAAKAEKEAGRSLTSRFIEELPILGGFFERGRAVKESIEERSLQPLKESFQKQFEEQIPQPGESPEVTAGKILSMLPIGGVAGITKKGVSKIVQKGKFVEKLPKQVQGIAKEKIIKPAEKAIFEQRREVIPDVELRELAKGKINVFDKFSSLPKGSTATGEEILAAREELVDRILKANLESKQEIEALQKGTTGIFGVRAEAGRAVRQFKLPVGETGEKALEKLIKSQKETKDPIVQQQLGEMIKVVSGNIKTPGFWDKLAEWATAIKLTSYRTPFRAGVGNLFGSIIRFPEKFVAGGIDVVRSAVTKTERQQFSSEAVADVVGTVQGFKEGARAAVKSLMDESFAAAQQRSAEAIVPGGAIKGRLGKIIRFPFRVISAPDAFFRTANTSGETAALATRQAMKEGLASEALANRVNELIKSGELKEIAGARASESVFQGELSKFMNRLNAIRNSFPVTKLIVPFFKTPAKLLEFSIKRSPLGLALPSFWKSVIQKGGPEANEAISRIVVGSGVLAGLTMYAADGSITGSWSNLSASERDTRLRQGMQPNSIKIGNKWYSYRGLEPLSFYLSFAAELAETEKEPSIDIATRVLVSLAEDFSNQPFLLGLNNIFEALTDPEGSGSRLVADFVRGSTIPVFVGDIARLMDPTIRKAQTIMERLQAQIPELSKGLSPKRNVWGEKIKREGGLAQRLSPIQISEQKEIPLEKELQRLNISVGLPQQRLGSIKLDNEEMDTFQVLSGRIAKQTLLSLIDSPDYLQLSDDEKIDTLNSVIENARRLVRDEMLIEVIQKRLYSPDKEIRKKFLIEELPELYQGASVERLQIINEAMKPPQKIEEVTPKQIPLPKATPENTLAGFNFGGYATAPDAMKVLRQTYDSTPDLKNSVQAQKEIDRYLKVQNQANPPTTQITGEMIMIAARKFGVPARMILALIKKETSLGIALRQPNNPANIGVLDTGEFLYEYKDMQEGVYAAARELKRRKI